MREDAFNPFQPPKTAQWLLSVLVPARFKQNVIGDLEEEYNLLATRDLQHANAWYWRQTMETSMTYIAKKFSSVDFVGRLNFYLPLMLLVLGMALVGLLSNLDDPNVIGPNFWDDLLDGRIYTALFSEGFWVNWQAFFASVLQNPSMMLDVPSFLITTANIGVLLYLYKRQRASALRLALWGYSLMLVPYIWGLFYIANNTLQAKQIGPIIALMLISLLYMLIPVSYLVHQRLKQVKADEEAYQAQKQQQDLASKD